ncbi:MAG: hypothetical protein JO362_20320, partial [Streptomycetaceae bacterium]|nr:hypothetical protein [Streptomycetaceae bacterium]
MPKKQSTAAKRARTATRRGGKYTTALRAEQAPARPTPARPGFAVRQAADLPAGRANEVTRRVLDLLYGTATHRWAMAGYYRALDERWLLGLAYAMLTDQLPELRPDPEQLRAAVDADDLAAVDALMEPLDQAVIRLLGTEPELWWSGTKARFDAYVTELRERELPPLADRPALDRWDQEARLADQWDRAWTEYRNGSGYMERNGVFWWAPSEHLCVLLADRHGAFRPRARVRLADGRQALVIAPVWAESGPPVAYRVRQLVPAPHDHAEPGKLIPDSRGDGETVPAADCHP